MKKSRFPPKRNTTSKIWEMKLLIAGYKAIKFSVFNKLAVNLRLREDDYLQK